MITDPLPWAQPLVPTVIAGTAIMVLTDETGFFLAIEALLTPAGCDRISWRRWSSLALSASPPADLLIVDLPAGDPAVAWTLLQRLRQRPATHLLPIIACAAEAPPLQAMVERWLETRCSVLQKPIQAAQLLEQTAQLRYMRLR